MENNEKRLAVTNAITSLEKSVEKIGERLTKSEELDYRGGGGVCLLCSTIRIPFAFT